MSERVGLNVKKPEVNRDNSDSRMRKTDHPRSVNPSVDRILFLQRTVGNQAVQRLMKSGALQAKLRIGQPGDKYEQEADRVADEVMRMPEPEMQRQVEEEEEEILQTKPLVDQITPLVQRQVEEEDEEEMLQAKSREDATSEVPNDLESHINAIKGGGRPMAESERAYFEPRFGYDFSQVRVHTDAQAAESARGLNARAYTVGQDVVFGKGEYSHGTYERRRLMGHELTHVIQQQNKVLNNGSNIQRLGEDNPILGPLSQISSPTTTIGRILGRPLNSREIGVLRPVYGSHLNYFAMSICEARICSPDSIPRTIGNIIGVPAGFSDNTLIHESAHVWQHQNGVPFGYAVDALTAQLASWLITGSRLGAYDYSFLERWHIPWRFWNAEQQASWIEDNRRLPSFLVWGIGRGMLPP